jgi:hypothetical protein
VMPIAHMTAIGLLVADFGGLVSFNRHAAI